MRFLVTGATGYIGGRLVGRLLGRGHQVRVLVREPGRIAGSGALGRGATNRFEDREGIAREERSRSVDAPAEAVFRSFSALGGERGWLVWRRAWQLRGFLDKLVGGPGLRRGRRHPVEILAGEALDFWRVEEVRPPHLMRLRAEMRLPGKVWLQFEAVPEDGGTRLVQTALFAPRGMWGALYWYGSFPVHRFIFSAMVDALARDALRYAREGAGTPPPSPTRGEPIIPGDPGHPTSPTPPRTA